MSFPDYKDGFTNTTIDLADDLLKTSTEITAPPSEVPESLPFQSAEEGLENAKILMNEGLYEEAKRTLHRVILIDPRNLRAKRLLQDVHDIELKQIFLDSPRRRSHHRTTFESPSDDASPVESVIESLDNDLGLNLLNELKINEPAGFAESIESQTTQLAAKDRIDLGIAFYELGLLETAARQFRMALVSGEETYSATCLLAQTRIEQQNGFDATLVLEPLVSDPNIEIEHKIEVYYLLGRAYCLMSDMRRASQWFGEVLKVDSNYRDTADRINRLR